MSRIFGKFRNDLLGITLLAAGLFLGLALLSYNPQDPSFNSIGHGLKVLNWCGYVGSFLADLLFQLWGLAAWLLIPGLFRFSYLSFRGEELSMRNLKLLWGGLLILVMACLVGTYFPETRLFKDQILAGGLLGTHLSQAMIRVFNLVGVQIVLWCLVAMLVIFFSEQTLEELSEGPREVIRRAWRVNYSGVFASFWVNRGRAPADPVKRKSAPSQEARPEALAGFIPPPPIYFGQEAQGSLAIDTEPEANANAGPPPVESTQQKRRVVMKTKIPHRIENWDLPKLSLVEDPPVSRVKVDQGEIKEKARTLIEKLGLFGVAGEVVAAKPGPAVTMFEFRPESSVKISKITELEDDLSMALASESLRILAPIPGRDVVGIETSNRQRETVYMKDMLAEDKFWSEELTLPLALGRKVDGQPEIVDLRKMPHLMVAGTTGSGKSVFTVSAISGLIYRHSPKTLRLILIDPKQVDLAVFEKVPHLALPVVTDAHKAVLSLKWAVREMEKRYKSMSRFGARKLEEYNEKVSILTKEQNEEHEKINQELEQTPGKKSEMYYHQPLPYLVIVVEEFADLMTIDKGNVEHSVVRLAQKARAAGVHLILCLQSPRKEFVTGAIKSNIPGRIAFKAASSMESRIILDDVGAERLLATGDMLYRGPGSSAIVRHHGPFLKDSDISSLTQFWSKQGEPLFDQNAMAALEGSTEGSAGGEDGADSYGDEGQDDRYDEILNWAQTLKEVSASLIQRRFQLGYPRAARIIETFERQGVVGPPNGSKPRQVLIHNLNNLV